MVNTTHWLPTMYLKATLIHAPDRCTWHASHARLLSQLPLAFSFLPQLLRASFIPGPVVGLTGSISAGKYLFIHAEELDFFLYLATHQMCDMEPATYIALNPKSWFPYMQTENHTTYSSRWLGRLFTNCVNSQVNWKILLPWPCKCTPVFLHLGFWFATEWSIAFCHLEHKED